MAVIINGGLNIGGGRTLITSQPFIPIDINFACVSGAGSTEVNGTYTFIFFGTLQGVTRPYYQTADEGYQIGLISDVGGPRWSIVNINAETTPYYGLTQPIPEYPWQETSWTIFQGGIAPLPIITIGPCQ